MPFVTTAGVWLPADVCAEIMAPLRAWAVQRRDRRERIRTRTTQAINAVFAVGRAHVAELTATAVPVRPVEPMPAGPLTSSQVADLIGYSDRWVRKLADRGEIAHTRDDAGRLGFELAAVEQFIRDRGREAS